jgi:hypothetical protein
MRDSELLDKYFDKKRMWHFEMEKGVDNLTTLCNDLGYNETPFKYGSPLEQFLVDNSGAQEALLMWIEDNMVPEWRDAIKAELPELNESESEDEDDE